jgi:hypothetical protein
MCVALLQLTTRTFSFGGKEVLLPIVDLANHDNACMQTHRVEPCDIEKGNKQRSEGLTPPEIPDSLGSGTVIPAQEGTNTEPAAAVCSSEGCSQKGSCGARNRGVSGICIVWRAETVLLKGSEVCNNYGLLQDNALLQYGFR